MTNCLYKRWSKSRYRLLCFQLDPTVHRSTSVSIIFRSSVLKTQASAIAVHENGIKMLKVFLCMVLALTLANGLPVRNRFNEDFDDYARDVIPKESSDFEDYYDAYLRRREPKEGSGSQYLCFILISSPNFLSITYMWLFILRLQAG